ncbi:hypothetical protein HD598_000284 [Neomicrococcus aestuarii]|uniref:Uncharacterized protein n=1 Tax=Neomicrococcus aestuarii TaxID=556325 RepID=A0A7W8WYV7_9MICC|nr:hypothetical protein [Neomicrococcus aestuarii]MBB5511597.1 hypothetical protein [Neomicrococcus aestuarii]
MSTPPRPDHSPRLAQTTRGARLRRTIVVCLAAVAVGVSVPLVYDAAAQARASAESAALAAQETGPADSSPDSFVPQLLSSIDALKSSGSVTSAEALSRLDSLRATIGDSAGLLLNDDRLRELQDSENAVASASGSPSDSQNSNADTSSAVASGAGISGNENTGTGTSNADPLALRVLLAQSSQYAMRESLTAEPERALSLARLAQDLRFKARNLGDDPSIGGSPAADQKALFKDPLTEYTADDFTPATIRTTVATLPTGSLSLPSSLSSSLRSTLNIAPECSASAAADIAYRLEYAYSVAAANAQGSTRELLESRTEPLTLLGHRLEEHNADSCAPVRQGGYVLPDNFTEQSGATIDAGLLELSEALVDLSSGQSAGSEGRDQLLALALRVQFMAEGAR